MALRLCVEVEQFTSQPGDTNPRTAVVLLPVVYSPAWIQAEWVVAEHPRSGYAVVSIRMKAPARSPDEQDGQWYELTRAIAECDRLNQA